MHYAELVSLYSLMAPSRLSRTCTITCKCVFTSLPCLTTRRPASCGAFCCPCDTRERDLKRRWDREAKAARPRLDSDAFTSKSSKHRATYTTFWDSEKAVCHTSQAYHAVCHSRGRRHALSPTHPRPRPGAVYRAPDGRKFTASGALVPPNECCGFPCGGPAA